jgi:hypothetical protein
MRFFGKQQALCFWGRHPHSDGFTTLLVLLVITVGCAHGSSNTTVVNIGGSCGVKGSLFDDQGSVQYEVSNNDVWARVISLSPDFLYEVSSAGANMAEGPSAAYAHSFKQLDFERWSVSSVSQLSATSLNDGSEKFLQTDSDLKLLRVSFSRDFVSDSKLGTRVARAYMDHVLFLNQGTWVDQSHGGRRTVYCGVFLFTWRIENWPFCNRTVAGQDQCTGTGCKLQLGFGIREATNWVVRPSNTPNAQRYVFSSPANRNNMLVMNRVYSESSSDGMWLTRGAYDPECACADKCAVKEIAPFAGGACLGLSRS